MERFPVELLYILAFIGVVLFNILAQRAARRRQQQEVEQPPERAEPPAHEDALLEDVWGRTAAAPAAVVAAAPPPPPPRAAPPAAPRRLHPVRALLREPQGLRRAVVLMMVLGPCRAQEPPDQRP